MQGSAKALARRHIERQIIEDGTAIWKTKKEIESLLASEEKKQWLMLSAYNPWGKPGHGAPMPGALRKTKWTINGYNDENEVDSALSLGRPGHGAPLRTPSGKTRAFIKSDPLIRFQFHDSNRKAVDNDLRYRATPIERENYRKELDAIIRQKKNKSPENEEIEATLVKEGWTNNLMLHKMVNNNHCNGEQIYEITGGGVELVPLLAKHRISIRCPLPTTDITRMSRICNDVSKIRSTAPEYFQQLCHQVNEKEQLKKKEQREEIVESKKHFETWKGFWGRPGHGAPKALSQREKLEYLLHHSPSRRLTSCTVKAP